MVLVDTSVWIRSLAGRMPYLTELDRLLAQDQVIGHQLVYGELLIGDKGGRRKLLSAHQRLVQAELVPHRELVHFIENRHFNGRGIGWIDAHLLASAMVGRYSLWTAHANLLSLASELGVAYKIAGV